METTKTQQHQNQNTLFRLNGSARRKRQRQMKRESEKGDGWDYESEARGGGDKIGMVKLHMNLEDHVCLKSHLKALMSRLFQRLQTKKKRKDFSSENLRVKVNVKCFSLLSL